MEPRRLFTLTVHFGVGSRKPKDEEIFQFFRKQGWATCDLSAMYREDHSLLGPKTTFLYRDGTDADVTVADAGGVSKYVRVFGLPPEVEDGRIEEVLGKYGRVNQLYRERYPEETGFPIWSGVRIYYDELSNKCFVCGSKDHLKVDCKVREKLQENAINLSPMEPSSFASVLANCSASSQSDEIVSDGSMMQDDRKVTSETAITSEGLKEKPTERKLPYRFKGGKMIIDEEFAKYWDDQDEMVLERRAAEKKRLQDSQGQQ